MRTQQEEFLLTESVEFLRSEGLKFLLHTESSDVGHRGIEAVKTP
jgi:hypothetical protein